MPCRGISQVSIGDAKEQSERRFCCGFGLFLFFGGSMESVSTYLIVTNNPLVVECVPKTFAVEYHHSSYREILVRVRDMVYAGHRLYTHPLAGSVKPNETPYKSVVVSKHPQKMEQEEAMIILGSIETFDKFTPIRRELPEGVRRDFQLIDYTLLCGAVGLDAPAGLSNQNK